MRMKCFPALLLSTAWLLPAPGAASCFVEPFEPQLQAASVVYVGTIVASRLEGSIRERLDFRNYQAQPTIRHEVLPQLVYKGDPAQVISVWSRPSYFDPRMKRFGRVSEAVILQPGDTVLVVGNAGQKAWIDQCTQSRRWDPETSRTVQSVFPAGPREAGQAPPLPTNPAEGKPDEH